MDQRDEDVLLWLRGLAQRVADHLNRTGMQKQDLARRMHVSSSRVTYLLTEPERLTEDTIWSLSRWIPEFGSAYVEYTDLLRSKLPTYPRSGKGYSVARQRAVAARDLRELQKALDQTIKKLETGE